MTTMNDGSGSSRLSAYRYVLADGLAHVQQHNGDSKMVER